MPLDRSGLQERLDRSAFNRWLGVTADTVLDDAVHLSVHVRPEMMGASRGGMLHGGIVSSLVDIAASMAVLAKLEGGVATADLQVDYHRPSRGGTLQVQASVIRAGRTLATAAAKIRSEDGTLLATGRGLYALIPAVKV